MFMGSKYPKNQWIPIYPGTDTALLAAIAYYWITNKLINTELHKQVYGGIRFNNAPLQVQQQAATFPTIFWELDRTRLQRPLLGQRRSLEFPAATIQSLALTWANNNTYVDCQTAGANRAEYAGEWARMIVAVASLIGKVGGVSGNGIGGIPGDPTAPSITSGARSLSWKCTKHCESMHSD